MSVILLSLFHSLNLFFFFGNYFFLFGCTESSLLSRLFFSCSKRGLLSTCGVQASPRGGSSCCGARALGTQASVLQHTGSVVVACGLSCQEDVESSRTRG